MSRIRLPDILVVLIYVAGMVYVGTRFARRQTSTESYFVAKRKIPFWAMGISVMSMLVTSITYVAYPGSAYGINWSNLTPGFMLIVVFAIVGFTIVPFYREAVGVSAYEYFGKRFGKFTRLYAALAFSLAQFAKMGFMLYMFALVVFGMTGWNVDYVIPGVGVVTVSYCLIGGIEAVIWTEIFQGVLQWAAALTCLGFLLLKTPGGPSASFQLAWESGKFSLGSTSLNFSSQTVIVSILYGFFWYLQKYVADQTMVQRYLVAKSHRDALKGISLGAIMCVPVWALFMLIGTMLWSFYKLTHEQLPSFITKADQVFPHFLATHIPPGLAGLFLAAIMAAAMSGLASDLNCLSVVCVEDFLGNFRQGLADRSRLTIAKIIVGITGTVAISTGLLLARAQGSALTMWFAISSILSGGLAGVFLLAFLSKRANRHGLYIGIIVSLLFTCWATLTVGKKPILDLGSHNFPMNEYMIGVISNILILVVGYVASLFFVKETAELQVTVWYWVANRKQQAKQAMSRAE